MRAIWRAFDLLLWILGAYGWMAITFWFYERRRRGAAGLSEMDRRENKSLLGQALAWSAALFGFGLLVAKWLGLRAD